MVSSYPGILKRESFLLASSSNKQGSCEVRATELLPAKIRSRWFGISILLRISTFQRVHKIRIVDQTLSIAFPPVFNNSELLINCLRGKGEEADRTKRLKRGRRGTKGVKGKKGAKEAKGAKVAKGKRGRMRRRGEVGEGDEGGKAAPKKYHMLSLFSTFVFVFAFVFVSVSVISDILEFPAFCI